VERTIREKTYKESPLLIYLYIYNEKNKKASESMSANLNVTVPVSLREAVRSYMQSHPEFNLSGYIQKHLRELILREQPTLLAAKPVIEVASHESRPTQ